MTACADRRIALACGLVLLLAGCASSPAPEKAAAPAASGPKTIPLPGGTAPPTNPAAPGAAAAAPAIDYAAADQRFQDALKLLKDHKIPQARDAFTALAKDYPTLSGPLTDLAILQAQGKQRDQAIVSFNQAIAANPSNATANNWLGALYREGGDYARAEAAYRRALAINPDYASAHLNLAVLYDVWLNRPQDALSQYQAYLKSSGKPDLKVQAWIGALQAHMSQTTTAQPGAKP